MQEISKTIAISIIIPVYNTEKYIVTTLDGLLEQTFKNFEVILVDDGSTDDSGMICDKYAENYDFIHSYHKPNGGAGSARNYGFDRIRGEYVYFMDSDDWLEPNAFETMYRKIEENNLDVLLFAAKTVFESPDRTYGFKTDTYRRTSYLYEIMDGKRLLVKLFRAGENYCNIYMRLFKAEYLRVNNVYIPEDMKVHHDEPFGFWSMVFARRAMCIPDILYNRFVREKSLTTSQSRFDSACNYFKTWLNISTGINLISDISKEEKNGFLRYAEKFLKQSEADYVQYFSCKDRLEFVFFIRKECNRLKKKDRKSSYRFVDRALYVFIRTPLLYYYIHRWLDGKILGGNIESAFELKELIENVKTEWYASDCYYYIDGVYEYEEENDFRWAGRNVEVILNTLNKREIIIKAYVPEDAARNKNSKLYFYLEGIQVNIVRMAEGMNTFILNVSEHQSDRCDIRIVSDYRVRAANGDIRELSYILKSIIAS